MKFVILGAFGFSFKIEALLLNAIYPSEDFLKEGQPEVRTRKGKYETPPEFATGFVALLFA